MLVYEYVNYGNFEHWLHGAMLQKGSLTWMARIKILVGIAKALTYLHEAIEPKVVHRDIKSSNILIDDEFNAKVSDFGLAKLLRSGKSHITTRVMGTFRYVAPEYANNGLLNERVMFIALELYCWRQLLGEILLIMVVLQLRRSEVIVEPNMEERSSTGAVKRALLTALRCVDPDSEKRPGMGQVVPMLESDDPIPREGRKHRRSLGGSTELDLQRDNSDTDKSDNPDSMVNGTSSSPNK